MCPCFHILMYVIKLFAIAYYLWLYHGRKRTDFKVQNSLRKLASTERRNYNWTIGITNLLNTVYCILVKPRRFNYHKGCIMMPSEIIKLMYLLLEPWIEIQSQWTLWSFQRWLTAENLVRPSSYFYENKVRSSDQN